ncbi:hypothetical protein [Flavobacterium taihuense]|uniref:Uncharacterized protein n=1 Tax=Flavobacterium taihuense TaxID=2857508 RepID=A0ABS6XR88_9FLAO|nr:hypothetical protein [Flavobacterium taihuense]MBW4359195.1 hypothetical protein [Flavobacterium taihuense]
MKKRYLLIILFLFLCKSYGQEPIQEAYVSKTYVNVDDEWSEVNFSSMVNVASNRKGQLKITNAEFLSQLSDGKANMVEKSAYNSAEFTAQVLTKEKTEKNGLLNLTFEGNLVFKTFDKAYTAASRIIFIINQADIIGLKIYNKDTRKEYAFDLQIKD